MRYTILLKTAGLIIAKDGTALFDAICIELMSDICLIVAVG